VKYIARAGKKDPEKTVEDLKKARFYLDREIDNLSPGGVDAIETNLDAIERLSTLTGFSAADVVSMALGVYEDAVNAKKRGLLVGAVPDLGTLDFAWFGLFEGDNDPNEEFDDDENEPEAPEPFKVGDPVTFATEDDPFPAEGVVKNVFYGQPVYTVDWKEMDGTEWSDEHWGHELVRREVKASEPTDQSKTIHAVRCAKCGMPIMPGHGVEVYNWDKTTTIHDGCFPDWPYKKVSPAEPEIGPDKPKFATGDKVRAKWSDAEALVYRVGDDNLAVLWTDYNTPGILAIADAVHVEK
jgi:hypothetical protein